MRRGPVFATAVALATLIVVASASNRHILQDKDVKDGLTGGTARVVAKLSKGASAAVAATGASALSMSSVAAASNMKVLKNIGVVIFDSSDTEATTASLLSNSNIESAETDFEVHIADVTPNDPGYGQLWGMPRIRAPAAWDVTTGDHSVVVCVIDTGVDYTHPDLANNMWVNPGETGTDTNGNDKATNGIDDDNNGYVDDVHGINAITGSGDPMDDQYHGTHCAGTIGAEGNNQVGVVGVAHEVAIMGCKFLSSTGSGSISHALTCVDYALEMGAPITSNSWGGGGFSSTFLAALNVATSSGQLFVAAAGNSAVDNDVSPHYPSNYSPNVDAVLSVAAMDQADSLSSFSQWGATTVDIAAPGSNILSTVPNNQYGSLSGTSMATPHVAGAAALILANQPGLSGQQLKNIIMESAASLASLSGKVVTGGVLDVAAAVSGQAADPAPTAAYQMFAGAEEFDLSEKKLEFTASDSGYDLCVTAGVPSFDYSASDGTAISLGDDASHQAAFTSGFTFTYFGDTYSSVFIGSNGFLTFASGDSHWQVSAANHNSQPRVSALFTDLTPDPSSRIQYQQMADKFVVTYSNVMQYGSSSNRNSFQVVLHESGNIEITYLDIQTTGTILAGLASGNDLLATDLSDEACEGPPAPAPITQAPVPTQAPTAAPTPAPPEYTGDQKAHFEDFALGGSGFDLSATSVTLVYPSYEPCVAPYTQPIFPDDDTEATVLDLGDDSFEEVRFSSGFSFPFFSNNNGPLTYIKLFVGSNGFVTFDEGDTAYDPSLDTHNSQPRISGLFTDLHPDPESTIKYQQMADRFVVTYYNIKQWGSSDKRSSFQMSLAQDGSITITYLQVVNTNRVIAGLSSGLSAQAQETDLSASDSCAPGTGPSPGPSPGLTPAPVPCGRSLIPDEMDLSAIATVDWLPQLAANYPLIVGGTEAQPGRYPYMANLATSSGFVFCGGSLIAPSVVLSAAHCAGHASKIYIGRHDVSSGTEVFEEFDVLAEIKHPEYSDTTLANDFMLIKLSGDSSQEPIRVDAAASSGGNIQLPVNGPGGEALHVMGWGTTSAGGSSSARLLEVDVEYKSNPDCDDAYGAGTITDAMMCAGSPGHDSCQGDSGGPLILKGDEATYDVQVGVVSWGIGCADPRYPGVYARISDARGWMDYQLGQWGLYLPDPCLPPGSSTPAPAPTPAPPATPPPTQAPTPAPVTISCPAADSVRIVWTAEGQEATCETANPGDAVVCDGSFSVERTSDAVTATCLGTVLEVRTGQRLICAQSIPAFADRGMGNPHVWSFSAGGGQTCQIDKDADFAQEHCSSLGARLCTLLEVQAQEIRSAGCGFNSRPLWTSDACTTNDGQAGLMKARGFDGANAVCEPVDGGVASVGCCAEQCVSETCAENIPGFADRGKGSPDIWAFSSGGGQGCKANQEAGFAQEHCSSLGARVCTLSELKARETSGSGCGFDGHSLWTSDACTTDDGQQGFMKASGSNGSNAVCAPVDGGVASVRCCADTCSGALDAAEMQQATFSP